MTTRREVSSLGYRSTILLVDDEQELLDELRIAVEHEGHRCYLATSGTDALHILGEHTQVDVIVSDIRMPTMDGMQLLSEIRKRFNTRPWLQVIFVTGYASLDVAVQALRLDAVDFLTKPIKSNQLLAVVEKAVQRATIERQVLEQIRLSGASSSVADDVARIVKVLSGFPISKERIHLPDPYGGYADARDNKDGKHSGVSHRTRGKSDDVTIHILESVVKSRSVRTSLFSGELFVEPAWDMLLELMQCRLKQKSISVSSLCIASGAPTTTALRRIEEMEQAGLVVRTPDLRDRRRFFLELTEDGAQKVANYLLTIHKLFQG